MNYQRIYDAFIADRKSRAAPYRGERHHVVPKCLGGGEGAHNIVTLSFEDHLFAHVLLARIHGGRLAQAASLMIARSGGAGLRLRSRYAWLRSRHAAAAAEIQRQRMQAPSVREAAVANLLRPKTAAQIRKGVENRDYVACWTPEKRAAAAQRATGRKASIETRKKMSLAQTGPVTEAHRQALSVAGKTAWEDRPRDAQAVEKSILRAEAVTTGQSRFVVSFSCSRGHDGLRYTSNGGCVSCSQSRNVKRYGG
jgi:hypothetical protein